jgi:hypothetical protein
VLDSPRSAEFALSECSEPADYGDAILT